MIAQKEAVSASWTLPSLNTIALLHTHTRRSDGMVSPRDVVMSADKLSQELDRKVVIAITDHDTMNGVKEARCAGLAAGIDVVLGEEITAKGRFGFPKHILALGIENPIPSGRSPEWTIEQIKKVGGIVIIPHPLFFHVGSLMEGEIRELTREFTFDAVEVRS